MSKKRGATVLTVIVFAAFVIGAGAYVWANLLTSKKTTSGQPTIGGSRDAHGCIQPAGYAWCEAKQKCLRAWEEECPLSEE
jgi:hypothetical protein